jgi:hypothetical protein
MTSRATFSVHAHAHRMADACVHAQAAKAKKQPLI